MEKILPLIFLGILSLQDIKEKRVPAILLVGFVALSLITSLFLVEDKIDIPIGLLPGVAVLVASKITGGKIGLADGIAMLGIGMFLGCIKTILMFLACLLAATIIGYLILITKKKGKSYNIPFIPFLFLGTSLCVFI